MKLQGSLKECTDQGREHVLNAENLAPKKEQHRVGRKQLVGGLRNPPDLKQEQNKYSKLEEEYIPRRLSCKGKGQRLLGWLNTWRRRHGVNFVQPS